MKLRITATIAGLSFAASISAHAATSPFPAQILCIPDEHHRTGLEKIDVPGSVGHLFEYGGKVTVENDSGRMEYKYGEGSPFYILKEKTAYSEDFLRLKPVILISHDAGWADSSGFLILKTDFSEMFFRIDWDTRRYYGFVHDFGEVNSYAGSCSILKK